MIKRILLTTVPALLILLNSLSARASFYDIVCVECRLETAEYQFSDTDGKLFASGDLTVPGASSDFEITQFFSFPLIGHDVEFFWGAGTYTFDSVGDVNNPGQDISMTVNAGQVGMHFLFDWQSYVNIDILNVFDVSYLNGDMTLTPVDVDGNGVVGFSMVDGPFLGSDMATNFVVATPVPAAAWLFGSGLIGLVGFARSKPHKK